MVSVDAAGVAKPLPVILSLRWHGVYIPIQEMMLNYGPRWLRIKDINLQKQLGEFLDFDSSWEKVKSVAVRVGGRYCVLKIVAGFGSALGDGHMYGDAAGCTSIHSLVKHAEWKKV